AAFDGSTISLEELTAQLPTGRLTASGSYSTTSNAFNLQAQAKDLPLALIESFIGGARRLPQLAGQVDLTASASGTLTEPSTYQIALEGQGRDVTINGRPAGVLTLVGRTEGQQFNLEFTTGLLGGERGQVVTARVDLSNNELPVTVETTLTGADLTPLFEAFLPGAATVRVTGQATGAIKLSGNLAGDEGFSLAGLRGTANFTDLAVQIEDIRLTAESPLLVQFSPAEIFFEKTRFTGPGTDILFGGTFALNESGKQNLSITGELNLRVLNGISPDVFLSGVARIGVRVNGTYADPLLTGTAQVSGASVNALVTDQRLSVSNIDGRVRFSSDQAEIESLTGRLGGGRLTVTGGALLDGFALTQFRLNLNGDNVSVPFPEDFRSTADLNIELQGTSRAQFITGTVNLRRAEYMEDIELADLISQRREASITQGGDGGGIFGARTQLDLRVEGRDALVVRNNLADVVGSVSLRIIGSLDDPIVAGRITATSGTLNFRNDRYELTRAYIDLPARRDADPLLNIQAEAEIKGYQVIVGLTGPLSQPNAIIRSEPALPQADVVSLITTGNLASDDTTTSALAQTGLGTAASLLTETLISAPAQRATDKLFGLNRFELDPLIAGRGGASPTARLTVGRQINRNLSITYSTNLTADQNQVLALEYRLSNRLSFIAQYEQGSVSGFTSRNNNFSFEIRFRRRF
ncbi:MAG TPA: translocation/assembly module TamB domain-containing protein, partial [Pyrinomonadaceae bacterium]|nr:translocation/assembly module TamB domain-containing protein [Pyrinomonadaceae bacterium]